MTRFPNRRLLAIALASTLAAPAWAQQPVDPQAAFGVAPQPAAAPVPGAFTVSDIRVDGLQRIGAGTVFTYLPIERGDTVDASRIGDAIRALYATGFFEDVSAGRQGDILVLQVKERPAINKLTLTGNKDIKTEDLTKGLTDIGLAEGETFDRLALDRVTQELTRQYNNRGKYNVQITPTVSPLDRNRVDVGIKVDEGKAARIRHINLIGNETFDDETLTDTWESGTSNWLSWYRRDDQYSREKLEGDREKLRNFYLDRGYVDFSEDNIQVAISPDKRDMYITAGLTEGEVYTVDSIEVTGDTILPKEDIERLVLLQPEMTFSRALLEFSSDQISATLSNIGYTFAQVNVVPQVDRENRRVDINLQVVPGPRVSVRRIVFKGNSRTADEVMRREMRQFEGAWYSQAAIDRSKVRLQRLGFFESGSVNVESKPVPGSNDQVDVEFSVTETTSGSFMFGVGYSQLSGMTTSVQLSQNNFLGSGNRISIEAQRNVYLQRYSFSYMNPYFNDSGLSLGYNLWWREFDNSEFNTAQYSSTSRAAQMVLGVPITEHDTVSAMFGIDSNQIFAFRGSSPQSIVDYIDVIGQRTFHAWRGEVSWARDTRNDFLQPTRGTLQRVSAEVTLPGSTAEYYKLNYEFSKYWPLSRAVVLNTRLELGYGDSYGDPRVGIVYDPYIPADANAPPTGDPIPRVAVADGLPFFENFYAGGARSVRGFRDNTLGPREAAWNSSYQQVIGGAVKTIGSLEMFFPTLLDSPAARVSAFVDFGNVFKDVDAFDAGELRASAGVALMWRAPVGPISISYAMPLRKEDGDELERLQFTFGGAF
ncbi:MULTISPECIES: outer membrane protein assembly factor BamA [unclassified Luteimonas]|uniref:outer membrane protein assembly factor BamA n=1 Tax=unclassified Luteimonas TaxID=2629088 RepID=UPI0018F0F9C8|nr:MULTISPECIES: outer membrane protein assembly factor BamA [unclassified Luteimonas]MBJ6977976.1 outer membrane protein assembly factor BamA [Luteimonas sp. MC1895]MBJ6984796.1 outer membrane protein assembly factor BamA [Luteimonas sp. MC1750]QQO07106.1 outer membrane protein assembly factor BamA [Luteimonas sp. MC1750]